MQYTIGKPHKMVTKNTNKIKRGKDINTQMVTESARFDIYGWNFDFNSSINVEFHDKQLCKNPILSQRPLSNLKSSIHTFRIDPLYYNFPSLISHKN